VSVRGVRYPDTPHQNYILDYFLHSHRLFNGSGVYVGAVWTYACGWYGHQCVLHLIDEGVSSIRSKWAPIGRGQKLDFSPPRWRLKIWARELSLAVSCHASSPKGRIWCSYTGLHFCSFCSPPNLRHRVGHIFAGNANTYRWGGLTGVCRRRAGSSKIIAIYGRFLQLTPWTRNFAPPLDRHNS